MPFKKFRSLIFALRSLLMAFLTSSLFSTASRAPFTVPSSFAGRSIVCRCKGTFGARASVSPDASSLASSFLCRFAAMRRCFLDFATEESVTAQQDASQKLYGILTMRRKSRKTHRIRPRAPPSLPRPLSFPNPRFSIAIRDSLLQVAQVGLLCLL